MRYFDINDDMAWFPSGFAHLSTSFLPRRDIQIVNMEDYEVVTRKHVIEREIKAKEESLRRLKEQKSHEIERFDSEIKRVEGELANLELRQKEFKKLK